MVTLQNEVFQAKASQLAEFESDKPRLKAFLHALDENRVALKKEIARLQAIVNKGTGLGSQGRPPIPSGTQPLPIELACLMQHFKAG